MNDQTDMNKGFLKDKLANYQVDPPDKVWNGISGQIGGRRNRKGMYILLLASAASIALALILGIPYFSPDLPEQESISGEIREEDPAGQNETSKLEQKVVETLELLPEKSTAIKGQQSQKKDEQVQKDPTHQIALLTETKTEAEERTVIPAEASTETLEAAASDLQIELLPDSALDLQMDPFLAEKQERQRDPRWMLGAALSLSIVFVMRKQEPYPTILLKQECSHTPPGYMCVTGEIPG